MAMDVETCLSYIGGYINGEYSSSNATFKQAIKDLCKSSKVPSVPKWNITIGGQSADRYDDYIRAFRYYWRVRNESVGFNFNNGYIKAMIRVESSMGTDSNKEGTKDVMQCMYYLDPAVYCMARVTPSNSKVLYNSIEASSYGIPSDGFSPMRNLFINSNGNLVHSPISSKKNYIASICFGIFWLGYKTAHAGSIEQGIADYNGRPGYLDKVLDFAANPR